MIFTFLFISCDDSSTSPQSDLRRSIKVIDENGNPIPKVEVTYLYNGDYSTYQPKAENPKRNLAKLSNIAADFKLYQNIPNPINHISHIRFGVPSSGDVKIELRNIKEYNQIFNFNKNVEPGLYQFFINISDSSFGKFKNGFYRMSLSLITKDGSRFNDFKDVYIISDMAQKDYITNSTGSFYYTNKELFLGSNYSFTLSNGDTIEKAVEGPFYFRLQKDGYYPSIVSIQSNNDFTLVILTKEVE